MNLTHHADAIHRRVRSPSRCGCVSVQRSRGGRATGRAEVRARFNAPRGMVAAPFRAVPGMPAASASVLEGRRRPTTARRPVMPSAPERRGRSGGGEEG